MDCTCSKVKELTEVAQRCASNTHRLDGHDRKIEEIERTQTSILLDLASNMKLLTKQIEIANGEISGIKQDVKELKEKPVRRYDTVVTVIITALVSGVVGYALSRLF